MTEIKIKTQKTPEHRNVGGPNNSKAKAEIMKYVRGSIAKHAWRNHDE